MSVRCRRKIENEAMTELRSRLREVASLFWKTNLRWTEMVAFFRQEMLAYYAEHSKSMYSLANKLQVARKNAYWLLKGFDLRLAKTDHERRLPKSP